MHTSKETVHATQTAHMSIIILTVPLYTLSLLML